MGDTTTKREIPQHFHIETKLLPRFRGLGIAAVAVYCCLAQHCHKGMGERYEVWPGLQTIMKWTMFARRSVQRALTDLREAGIIYLIGKHPRTGTNKWLLVHRAPPEVLEQYGIEQEGPKLVKEGAAQLAPPVGEGAAELARGAPRSRHGGGALDGTRTIQPEQTKEKTLLSHSERPDPNLASGRGPKPDADLAGDFLRTQGAGSIMDLVMKRREEQQEEERQRKLLDEEMQRRKEQQEEDEDE